jgi:type I restriction enzyme S subunit
MKDLKPYPKYKDSGVEWISEIPQHWEVKPLYALMCERNEKNINNKVNDVLSLSYGNIIPRDVSDNFGLLPESFETYQIVHPGNIILRLTDLQNDHKSLRVGLVKQTGIITSAYVCLGITNSFSIEFASSLLHSYDLMKVFYTYGGGVRQSMKYEDLKRLPILCPTDSEQKTISSFLDRETARIDSLIAKKQRLIELLKEKRTALITQAVTKGLDPNVPMKDSGVEWLGKVPARWAVLPLKRVVGMKITDGPHETPEILDDGIPFISAEAIKNEKIDFELRRGYISYELHQIFSEKCKPKKNDIFFVKSGATTGNIAMVEVDLEFSIWSPLAVIRADNNRSHHKFLFYSLLSKLFRDQVEVSWSYGTQQNIGMGVIENLLISLPPYSMQKDIADFLDRETVRIGFIIAKTTESIEKLKEYRSALISAAVTGKVDVRSVMP